MCGLAGFLITAQATHAHSTHLGPLRRPRQVQGGGEEEAAGHELAQVVRQRAEPAAADERLAQDEGRGGDVPV